MTDLTAVIVGVVVMKVIVMMIMMAMEFLYSVDDVFMGILILHTTDQRLFFFNTKFNITSLLSPGLNSDICENGWKGEVHH